MCWLDADVTQESLGVEDMDYRAEFVKRLCVKWRYSLWAGGQFQLYNHKVIYISEFFYLGEIFRMSSIEMC